VVTFTPFHRWRHDHAVHHATAGNLDKRGVGDIWTMTVDEYRLSPWWMRLGYRIVRNPFFLCTIGSAFLFLIIQRIPPPKAGKEERMSVIYTDLALLAVFLWLGMYFGYLQVFLVLLMILFFSSAAGVWLFYVQHQFEGAYWERKQNWSFVEAGLRGSSFYKLPGLLQWFSGNIGFHHIHHLSPKIPNYNLPRCHRDTPAFQVKPLTILASLKAGRLHLWDEASQRLVGWEILKKPQPVPVRELER
jgi:omega-6 fatty acid desaturase (delta-12 desaturase)